MIIHIDAEDDAIEEARESADLPPLRKIIRADLYETWRDQLDQSNIIKMDLHYLNNQVDVELYLKKGSPAVTSGELKKTASEFAWLGEILVWYEP